MGQATRLKCEGCAVIYYATRRDSKYHSAKCRQKIRAESAKFITPNLPRSGIAGITFGRILQRWVVKLKIDNHWEYKGAFKTLKQAIAFHKELTT